jgi:hypothetical protein
MKNRKGITRFILILMAFVFLTGAIRWNTREAMIETQVATGAVALATTLAPGVPFKLLEVRVHLSAASATAENFTATMDAAAGVNYDAVIFSKDLNTLTSYVYAFEDDRYFTDDDEIDFAWANTDTRTYGLEIVYQTYR